MKTITAVKFREQCLSLLDQADEEGLVITKYGKPVARLTAMRSRMRTKLEKWGNSLGLRIPKELAEQAGVGAGSEVDLSVEEAELIVRPVRLPRYDLGDLLRGVTAKNVHREVEIQGPVGQEVW